MVGRTQSKSEQKHSFKVSLTKMLLLPRTQRSLSCVCFQSSMWLQAFKHFPSAFFSRDTGVKAVLPRDRRQSVASSSPPPLFFFLTLCPRRIYHKGRELSSYLLRISRSDSFSITVHLVHEKHSGPEVNNGKTKSSEIYLPED